jgi:hypothetical protein
MLGKISIAALIVAGAMLSTGAASARVICNEDGDCWHAYEQYTFPPGIRLEVHPDGGPSGRRSIRMIGAGKRVNGMLGGSTKAADIGAEGSGNNSRPAPLLDPGKSPWAQARGDLFYLHSLQPIYGITANGLKIASVKWFGARRDCGQTRPLAIAPEGAMTPP